MYNNNYTRPKVALKAQDIRRSKGKSCGYYLRIIFFFSSLIQSLIIVSLVLFLVYGQPAKSADEKRVEELELSFSKLSSDNTNLRKEKADLIAMLKTKTAEKDAADKKVVKITADLDAAKVNNTKCLQALVSLHSFWLTAKMSWHTASFLHFENVLLPLQKQKDEIELSVVAWSLKSVVVVFFTTGYL